MGDKNKGSEKEEAVIKVYEETCRYDGYAHSLDGGDGFADVDICENLTNCTLWNACFMSVIP